MNKEAIEDLRSDDRLKLKQRYHQHKNEFLGFGKRYNLDQSSLEDVYQEAFLALRKLPLRGKLESVKSSMKTYLFGIGKHKILDVLKARQKEVSHDSFINITEDGIQEIKIDMEPELNERQVLLRKYLNRIGEKCRQVLTLFYYRGLNIKEIMMQAGYRNENTVKAQKSRCLKTLREMMVN